MNTFDDTFDGLRLIMLSGKGGVGKTTLACGWARRWAQKFPQEKILLLSTDPAHSLGDVLQVAVDDTVRSLPDLPNLQVRALDAEALLLDFKGRYGKVLALLVERGSFVQEEDLTPVWDLSWPGLDELMGILEIQRILRVGECDRVVVDMAPSGHTLNLFGLMDFLDEFLKALELFQEKHRVISRSFTGTHAVDAADDFLQMMAADLAGGRRLLQDPQTTACGVVAIAEPMSLLETRRFLAALTALRMPVGGLFVNRMLPLDTQDDQSPVARDRQAEAGQILRQFMDLAAALPVFTLSQQNHDPVGSTALDAIMATMRPAQVSEVERLTIPLAFPEKVGPGFVDFVDAGRRLIVVGGKGGVGKTTVAAAIAWGMAQRHGDRQIRVISIDPAHSLGDALGQPLSHAPQSILPNLKAQEIDAEQVLEQFRADYLWELAAMMSGESATGDTTLQMAYGPEAWKMIVSQALPGIDEMLSLVAVMELLATKQEDLIILDTAPTGHLLRFLAMPTAMGDWLAWIFRLWIKYQAVLDRTEFMGRLRSLRQRVIQAQKQLLDPQNTEFIGVVQSQAAIVAEAQRLTATLAQMGVAQHYVVHNRYQPEDAAVAAVFPQQAIVRLPGLPRSVAPLERVAGAAQIFF